MKAIFKYPLQNVDSQAIIMPKDAVILCVKRQGASAFIWAIVDPDNQSVGRTILMVGTGHPLPEGAEVFYIGTYISEGGLFTWHCFERLK